jgi:hypothetical protein
VAVSSTRDDLKARIDAIESGYEYFLAYAAQGLTSDQGSKAGAPLRDALGKMEAALDGLPSRCAGLVSEEGLEPADPWRDLLDVLDRDVSATLAAIRIVSAQTGISSQLIDNLNANIHLRALLTDLFLIDDLIGRG